MTNDNRAPPRDSKRTITLPKLFPCLLLSEYFVSWPLIIPVHLRQNLPPYILSNVVSVLWLYFSTKYRPCRITGGQWALWSSIPKKRCREPWGPLQLMEATKDLHDRQGALEDSQSSMWETKEQQRTTGSIFPKSFTIGYGGSSSNHCCVAACPSFFAWSWRLFFFRYFFFSLSLLRTRPYVGLVACSLNFCE